MGFRVLAYLEDFLDCPSQGAAASWKDCRRTARPIDGLLRRYGQARGDRGIYV
jgi:hypothetical protein